MNSLGANGHASQRGRLLRFGDFEYDLDSRELRKHGIRIRLQPQPLTILIALLESHGALVSREALRTQLWGSETFVEFEQGLNSAIKRLRDALCDSADNPHYVETIPGEGYRFIAAIERSEAVGVAAVSGSSDPRGRLASFLGLRSENWAWASGIALVAAIAAMITISSLHRRAHTAPKQAVRTPAGPVRIAVLPFVNLTGDPGKEYLSDGMTEELITVLGNLDSGRLEVIARTSAMHYRNTVETASQIGQELKVDYLLEGSVQRSGNGVHVTAQLILASSASQVWAGEFDLRSEDAMSSQQGIAAGIADSIQLRLSPLTNARSRLVQTADPDAYHDYLLGRYYWNKRSREGLETARAYFQRAIDRDPNYARAYSGLADDYLVLGAGFMPADQAYPKARQAALRALQLDNRLPDAYASLAYEQYIEEWAWQEAEANYRRSLALDPNNATSHEWYAIFLGAMRRSDEAIKEIDRALELDPLSLPVNYNASTIYLQAGRNAEALELAKRSLEVDRNSVPAHLTLAAAYERTGQYPQAIAEFQRASQEDDEVSNDSPMVAHCYALQGNRVKAVAILHRCLANADGPLGGAYGLTLIYAALGEKNRSLYWLSKAVEERSCNANEINADWRLDVLRADPRFAEIRAQFGLPN